MSRVDELRRLNNLNLITPDELKEHFAHGESDEFNKKIKAYINDVVFLRQRYLFIKKVGKVVYAQCSYCGHRSTFEKVSKQKSEHICSACGKKLTARNTAFHNYDVSTDYEFVHFEQSSLADDILVAYQIATKRRIRGTLDECNDIVIDDQFIPVAYYYFDTKSKNRLIQQSSYCFDQHHMATPRFKQSMHQINSTQFFFWGISSESLAATVEDTEFRYSSYNRLSDYLNIIKYFDLYTKYPAIEKLMKAGFDNLIYTYLNGSSTYGCINWRATTIEGMLKLNKSEVSFFKRCNDLTFEGLKTTQFIKSLKYDSEKEWDAAIELMRYSRNIKEFSEVVSADKPSRIIGYLEKQCANFANTYTTRSYAYYDFRDLIKDMKTLEIPINKKTLYYKDLKRHHMNLSNQIKVKANEAHDKQIEERLPKLIKYQHENDQFILLPAQNTEQLINEGKVLGHCVGRYVDKYRTGETNIYCLRKKSQATEPFFTVEIDKEFKRVVQCYGKGHSLIESDKEAACFFSEYQELFLNKKASPRNERIAN